MNRRLARTIPTILWTRLIVACVVALIAAATARAQDDRSTSLPLPARSTNLTSDAPTARTSRAASSPSTWKTTGGALLFVTALVIVAAKFLRKGLPATPASLPGEVVEVLGRKPLDYKHTLHIVRCGSRLLLLGSSSEGLRSLGEITDPAEVEYVTGLCRPQEKSSVSAAAGDFWKRWRGEEGAGETGPLAGEADFPRDDEAAHLDQTGLRIAPRADSATFRNAAASGSSNEEAAA